MPPSPPSFQLPSTPPSPRSTHLTEGDVFGTTPEHSDVTQLPSTPHTPGAHDVITKFLCPIASHPCHHPRTACFALVTAPSGLPHRRCHTDAANHTPPPLFCLLFSSLLFFARAQHVPWSGSSQFTSTPFHGSQQLFTAPLSRTFFQRAVTCLQVTVLLCPPPPSHHHLSPDRTHYLFFCKFSLLPRPPPSSLAGTHLYYSFFTLWLLMNLNKN